MAFTPHWIDLAHGAGDTIDGNHRSEIYLRFSNALYCLWLAHYTGPFVQSTYKSNDSGQTWLDLGVSPNDAPLSENADNNLLGVVHDNKIFLLQMRDGGDPTARYTVLDPASAPAWAAPVVIPGVSTGTVPSTFGLAWAGERPDGSLLLAYQDDSSAQSAQQIGFIKLKAGVWTPLGTLPAVASQDLRIEYGVIDAVGNTHFLIARSLDDRITWEFDHVSVSSADVISGYHLIESNVETDGAWVNCQPGGGCIAPDGKIIFPYGFLVETNSQETSGPPNFTPTPAYGSLHVAFGDPSGDPLNPTWAITTVNPTPDLSWISGESVWTGTANDAGTLRAYYLTTYPAAIVFPNTAGSRLWRSTWSGSAWGTPELWFTAPGPDPTAGIDMLRLVRSFTNGVGIALDMFNSTVSGTDYVEISAYDGPPIGTRFSYASPGGAQRARSAK